MQIIVVSDRVYIRTKAQFVLNYFFSNIFLDNYSIFLLPRTNGLIYCTTYRSFCKIQVIRQSNNVFSFKLRIQIDTMIKILQIFIFTAICINNTVFAEFSVVEPLEKLADKTKLLFKRLPHDPRVYLNPAKFKDFLIIY